MERAAKHAANAEKERQREVTEAPKKAENRAMQAKKRAANSTVTDFPNVGSLGLL
jgi:membrane protein involved in colicin uptake